MCLTLCASREVLGIRSDQINQSIQQLDSVIQQNASASEEMASTAEELSSQSDQLADMISFFVIDAGEQRRQGSAAAASRNSAQSSVEHPRLAHARPQHQKGNDVSEIGDDEFERY